MHLTDEAWPDLEDYFESESLALVPLGSTEQHGPHLPLATDHLIAEAFADEAAERTGYLRAPTVRVGVSPHHRQFPGTAWVDAPVFRDYVESYVRNLAYHGIDRVVFVNAHGGNVQHLREVGRRLRDDDVAYAVEWMWDESIPDLVDDAFEHNGPHAGPKETALIQHLRPDLVHDERRADARDGGAVHPEESIRTRNGAATFYDTVENSPNGAFGDPTDASAEKGAELFDAASDQLEQLCEWLAAREWAELRAPERVTSASQ